MKRRGFARDGVPREVMRARGRVAAFIEIPAQAQPAPQLSALEIELRDVPRFADHVACQHYIITFGDNRAAIRDLCRILGIEVLEM